MSSPRRYHCTRPTFDPRTLYCWVVSTATGIGRRSVGTDTERQMPRIAQHTHVFLTEAKRDTAPAMPIQATRAPQRLSRHNAPIEH